MLYNLRASLDYVVWQLVIASGNVPGSHNAYPIVQDPARWAKARDTQLKGVHQQWASKIRALQPFHELRPDAHVLVSVDRANNVLKHRALPPQLMSLGHFSVNIRAPRGSARHRTDQGFEDAIADGVLFFRFRFDPPVRYRVESHGFPQINLSYPDGQTGHWSAETAFKTIKKIISTFDRASTRHTERN
jgi:hypothetical protein